MAASYAFAMHSLNIYLDRNAIELNDPGRAAFYHRWRPVFTGISVVALLIAIGVALKIGFLAFVVMGLLILFGLIYAVPVILPARWQTSIGSEDQGYSNFEDFFRTHRLGQRYRPRPPCIRCF